MGLIDNFVNYMKMNDDDDGGYYDDDYYDEEDDAPAESAKKAKSAPAAKEKAAPAAEPAAEDKAPKKSLPRITPLRQNKKIGDAGMEVCVIKPTSVEDSREITETLLAGRPVILNLEGLDVDIAQRIIDFTSGSCFALGGNLQKISVYIFIITPASVDISGDFQEYIGGTNSNFDVPLN